MTLSKSVIKIAALVILPIFKYNFRLINSLVLKFRNCFQINASGNFFFIYKTLCTFKFPLQNPFAFNFLNSFSGFYVKKHKNYLKFSSVHIEKISNFQWHSIYLKAIWRHAQLTSFNKKCETPLFVFVLLRVTGIALFNFTINSAPMPKDKITSFCFFNSIALTDGKTHGSVSLFYKNSYKSFSLKKKTSYGKSDVVHLVYFKVKLAKLKKFKGISVSGSLGTVGEPSVKNTILNKFLINFFKNKSSLFNLYFANIRNKNFIFYDLASRLFYDNKNMLTHFQNVLLKASLYEKFFFYKKKEKLLMRQNELLVLNNRRNNYIDWKSKIFVISRLIFFNKVRLSYKKKIVFLRYDSLLINFDFTRLFVDQDIDTCYLPNNIKVRKLFYNKSLPKFIYFRRIRHFVKYLLNVEPSVYNSHTYQIWKKASEDKNLMYLWLWFRKKDKVIVPHDERLVPSANIYDKVLLDYFVKLNIKHCYIPKSIRHSDVYDFIPKFLTNSPNRNPVALLRNKLFKIKKNRRSERWFPSDELLKFFLIAQRSYSDNLKYKAVTNLRLIIIFSDHNSFSNDIFAVNPFLLELYENEDAYHCYIPETITIYHIFMNIEAIRILYYETPVAVFRSILIYRQSDKGISLSEPQNKIDKPLYKFIVPTYFSKWEPGHTMFNLNFFEYLEKNPNDKIIEGIGLSIDLVFLDGFSREFFKNYDLNLLVKAILKKKYYLDVAYPHTYKKKNELGHFVFKEMLKNFKYTDPNYNKLPLEVKKTPNAVATSNSTLKKINNSAVKPLSISVIKKSNIVVGVNVFDKSNLSVSKGALVSRSSNTKSVPLVDSYALKQNSVVTELSPINLKNNAITRVNPILKKNKARSAKGSIRKVKASTAKISFVEKAFAVRKSPVSDKNIIVTHRKFKLSPRVKSLPNLLITAFTKKSKITKRLNIDRSAYYKILKKKIRGNPISFRDMIYFFKKKINHGHKLFNLSMRKLKFKYTLGLKKNPQTFDFLNIRFSEISLGVLANSLFSNVESSTFLVKKLFVFDNYALNAKFKKLLKPLFIKILDFIISDIQFIYKNFNFFLKKLKAIALIFYINFFKNNCIKNKVDLNKISLLFNINIKKNPNYIFNVKSSYGSPLSLKNIYNKKSHYCNNSFIFLKKCFKLKVILAFVFKKVSNAYKLVNKKKKFFKLLNFFFNNKKLTAKLRHSSSILKKNNRLLRLMLKKKKKKSFDIYFNNRRTESWFKKKKKLIKLFFKKNNLINKLRHYRLSHFVSVVFKKKQPKPLYFYKVSDAVLKLSPVLGKIVALMDTRKSVNKSICVIALNLIFLLPHFLICKLASRYSPTLILSGVTSFFSLLHVNLFNFKTFYVVAGAQTKKMSHWGFNFLYLIKPGFLLFISGLSSFLNSLFFFIKKQRLGDFFNKFWVDRGFFFPVELSLFKFFFLYYTNFFFNFFEVSTFLNFNNFYAKGKIQSVRKLSKTQISTNVLSKKNKLKKKMFTTKNMFFASSKVTRTAHVSSTCFVKVLQNFFKKTLNASVNFIKNKSNQLACSKNLFNFLSVTNRLKYVRYFRKTRSILKNFNFSSLSVIQNVSLRNEKLVFFFFFLKKFKLKRKHLNAFNVTQPYANFSFLNYYKTFNFFKNFIVNVTNLLLSQKFFLKRSATFLFKKNKTVPHVFKKTARSPLQISYFQHLKPLYLKKINFFFKKRLWLSFRKKNIILKKKQRRVGQNFIKKTLSFFSVKSSYKSKFMLSKMSTNFFSSRYIKNDNQSNFNYSKLLEKSVTPKFAVQNFFLKNKISCGVSSANSCIENYFFKPACVQKNKKLQKSSYAVKKKNIIFKMKPGYKVLWRHYRQEYKLITNLSYYRQRRLTNYFLNFKKSNGAAFLKSFEFSIFSILRRSTVFLDYTVSNVCFNLGMVFLNGQKALNKLFQVYVGDRVQVILSYNYLLQFKWFFFFINLRKIKFLTKYVKYFFNISNSFLVLRKRLLRFSEKLFKKLLYLGNDIPNYLEVDFMLMLVVVIYDPFLFCEFDPILIFRVPFLSLRLYNWKYIN